MLCRIISNNNNWERSEIEHESQANIEEEGDVESIGEKKKKKTEERMEIGLGHFHELKCVRMYTYIVWRL